MSWKKLERGERSRGKKCQPDKHRQPGAAGFMHWIRLTGKKERSRAERAARISMAHGAQAQLRASALYWFHSESRRSSSRRTISPAVGLQVGWQRKGGLQGSVNTG